MNPAPSVHVVVMVLADAAELIGISSAEVWSVKPAYTAIFVIRDSFRRVSKIRPPISASQSSPASSWTPETAIEAVVLPIVPTTVPLLAGVTVQSTQAPSDPFRDLTPSTTVVE